MIWDHSSALSDVQNPIDGDFYSPPMDNRYEEDKSYNLIFDNMSSSSSLSEDDEESSVAGESSVQPLTQSLSL